MADKKLRSACFDCPPEARDYDSPTCQNCTKRLERLTEIDGENVSQTAIVIPIKRKLNKRDLKEAKATIRNVCKRTGVNYKLELMAGVSDKNVSNVRKHLICLMQKVYRMSDGAIAELMNVTPQYVNNTIATRNSDPNAMVTFFGEDPEPKDPDDVIDESMIANGYMVMIDFSTYPELFKQISRMASDQMRPRKLQILFMLQAFIDREMNLGIQNAQ